MLYLAFFCSGLSGLIYQVVWVRVFGNVFGNTIYSASAVVAVFMLGLGAGMAFNPVLLAAMSDVAPSECNVRMVLSLGFASVSRNSPWERFA